MTTITEIGQNVDYLSFFFRNKCLIVQLFTEQFSSELIQHDCLAKRFTFFDINTLQNYEPHFCYTLILSDIYYLQHDFFNSFN